MPLRVCMKVCVCLYVYERVLVCVCERELGCLPHLNQASAVYLII